MTEDEFRQSRAKYGSEFDADMGAEAVKKMLGRLDLQIDLPQLQVALPREVSRQAHRAVLVGLVQRLETPAQSRLSQVVRHLGGSFRLVTAPDGVDILLAR